MAAILLAASLAPGARGDIDLPTAPPPQPQPVTAKVYVGESVDIPLSGFSRSGGGLKFIIRRQPSAGQLSEIRMTGPNTGVVTYTHAPGAAPGADGFRYAASAPGRGISTPADVVINVSERPAIFSAPARIDFPDTSVGETSTQSIEIRNDGGGLLEGTLTVPPPWRIVDGDGRYSLGAGGVKMITIAFTPDGARTFAATGEFSHAPGAELGLGGGGFNPIEVAPREIRLESDGRSEVRTGAFVLRNVSLDERDLRIIAPKEVIVQDSIRAGAQSESQIALHTAAGFLGAWDGKITIQGSGISFDVPVHVAAAPPRLTTSPASLDFGSLETGRAGRGKIVVHNAGGSAATLAAKVPEGVEIAPYPDGTLVEPGASREFDIRLSRPLPGKYSEPISFTADQSVASIQISAVIRPGSSVPEGAMPMSKDSAPREAAYNDIPPVMEVGVTRQTYTELDLEWKKTSPNVAKYELFMRTMSVGANGKIQFKFTPLDRVKTRFVRDLARVTLAGLRPGENVTICIIGVDGNGTPSRVSPMFTFATKAKAPLHVPWIGIGVAVLCVLAVFILRDRRRRRAAQEQEIERIEQV